MFSKLLSLIRGMEIRRRWLNRVRLIYIAVFNRTDGHLVGSVVDISMSGIRLMSREALTVDEVYEFKMDIPNTKPESGTREFKFDVRCVWCRKDVHSDLYGSGFEFRNIEMGDAQQIRNLIEQFGDTLTVGAAQ
ncbi:PilZ domain-containing protein [Desulfococcaceae bacterium HSG9]|nr:PilZ domain-containing protein [Desulfococcaceae bacterium HSG9]